VGQGHAWELLARTPRVLKKFLEVRWGLNISESAQLFVSLKLGSNTCVQCSWQALCEYATMSFGGLAMVNARIMLHMPTCILSHQSSTQRCCSSSQLTCATHHLQCCAVPRLLPSAVLLPGHQRGINHSQGHCHLLPQQQLQQAGQHRAPHASSSKGAQPSTEGCKAAAAGTCAVHTLQP
jgi:hypothetical protein